MRTVFYFFFFIGCTQFLLGQKVIAVVDVKTPTEVVSSNSSVFNSHFELNGGLILLEAKMNGTSGAYILDTGSSDVLLNKVNTKGHRSTVLAVGFDGNQNAVPVNIASFQIGELEKENFTAFKTDLSAFDVIGNEKITGIIGSSFFKDQTLAINYQTKYVEVLSTPDKSALKKAGWTILPMVVFDHILGVKIKIDKKAYWMGIDTGAEVNVLSDNFKNELTDKSSSSKMMIGLGNKNQSFQQINIQTSAIGDLSFYNNDFFVAPLDKVQEQVGRNLDGLLGFPFLEQFEVMIDYKNRRLYLR